MEIKVNQFSAFLIAPILAILANGIVTTGITAKPISEGYSHAKPNILIIYTDDQRFSDIDWFVNRSGKRTPAMDALFEKGIWMSQARVTTSMCVPSRYSMHTGHYASRSLLNPSLHLWRNSLGWAPVENNSVFGGHLIELRGSEATAGRLFQAAGYRTGFVGKWHLGGIHEIREYTADIKEIMEKEKELVANFGGFDQVSGLYMTNPKYQAKTLGLPEEKAVHNPTYLTQNVLNFIRDVAKDPSRAPFFLIYSPTLVHYPLVSKHDDPRIGPYGLIDPAPDANTRQNKIVHRWDEAGNKRRDLSVIALDLSIEAIMEELSRYKLDKDTLVLFMSDNNKAKSSVYDDGVAVPAVMFWDGRLSPHTYAGLFANIDILPTVLDAADIDFEPKDFDGRSAWLALTRKEDAPRNHLMLEQGFSRTIVSNEGWKYLRVELPAGAGAELDEAIIDYSGRMHEPERKGNNHFWRHYHLHSGIFDKEQLYNLKVDPAETQNQADNPEHAERLMTMRELLEAEVPAAREL